MEEQEMGFIERNKDKFKYVCSKGQAQNFLNEFKGICLKYGLTFSCDDPYCFPFVLTKLDEPLMDEIQLTINEVNDMNAEDFLFYEHMEMLSFDKYLCTLRRQELDKEKSSEKA